MGATPGLWPTPGCFDDVRVIEVGGAQGAFCGRLLSGEGCDVVKVEPPNGCSSRRIGPFHEDIPGLDRSLFFWTYNRGKRSVTLDLQGAEGRQSYLSLCAQAEVVIDAQGPEVMHGLGIGYEAVRRVRPDIVYCSITPFGLSGPWRDFKTTDLVHLALGGSAYLIGYDSLNPQAVGPPAGEPQSWDTPPFMPHEWHAYCITGEHAAMGVAAALLHRQLTGEGQFVDVSIHSACAHATEGTVPRYIYHGFNQVRRLPSQVKCADGRYLNFSLMTPVDLGAVVDTLAKDGMAEGLGTSASFRGPTAGSDRERIMQLSQAVRRWAATKTADEAFHALQACRSVSAPVNSPEDLLKDPQCIAREDFVEIEHPDLGRSFTYARHPRRQTETPWRWGPRAPLLGEHTKELIQEATGLEP